MHTNRHDAPSGETLPKISVLIPVYNAAKTLRRALDSLAHQGLPNDALEIVCVDDGSTDDSAQILESSKADFPGLRVVTFPENRGTLSARLAAIRASRGEWIAWLDPDDEFEAGALTAVIQEGEQESADIVEFRSRPVPEEKGKLTQSQQETLVHQASKAFGQEHTLSGPQAFLFLLQKHADAHLWERLFRGAFLRALLKEIPECYCVMAEDFVLLEHAYARAKTVVRFRRQLYLYHLFAGGITSGWGDQEVSLEKVKRVATWLTARKLAGEALSAFPPEARRQVDVALQQYTMPWSNFLVWLIGYRVQSPRARHEAWQHLLDCYGLPAFFDGLVEHVEDDNWQCRLSQDFPRLPGATIAPNAIRNIAIYFETYGGGGTERVLSLLMERFQALGLHVILITDEPPSAIDYPLPAGVKRYALGLHRFPSRNTEWFRHKARMFADIAQKEHLDAVFYQFPYLHHVFFDILLFRMLGLAILGIHHSVFTTTYYWLTGLTGARFREAGTCCADFLACLSPMDTLYFRMQGVTARTIPNPSTYDHLVEPQTLPAGYTLLWLGRFEITQKNPSAAVEMMRHLHRLVPQAKLRMKGARKDKEWQAIDDIQALIERYGLQDVISIEPFSTDVSRQLQESACLLMTSRYEGYGMVLVEAYAHGRPVAMFDLPYLLPIDPEATITAPQGDAEGLARAIAAYLQSPAERERRHRGAQAFFKRMLADDPIEYWRKVFSAPSWDVLADKPDTDPNLVRVLIQEFKALIVDLASRAQGGAPQEGYVDYHELHTHRIVRAAVALDALTRRLFTPGDTPIRRVAKGVWSAFGWVTTGIVWVFPYGLVVASKRRFQDIQEDLPLLAYPGVAKRAKRLVKFCLPYGLVRAWKRVAYR